ncbi:MAG: hypothetical protein ACI3VR_10630, partial [Intestinibacter sp.]|uniref:hypothetical protein n=1 Tax=Intestinibacter sp. TaxID=1965304 RepID=UPI003F16B887
MPKMKTEYLISIDNTQNICKDEKSFANLLMINRDIEVSRKTIKYKGKTYDYENKKYLSKKSDYIYFHIAITAEITDLSDKVTPKQDEQIRLYEELLSEIKNIVFKVAFKVQTIWDDVSFFYSKLAYPLIYDIENSMRKLITKFMVINVGTNWEKENTPEKLQNFSKKNKNEEMLYKFNFSQLSNYLFDEFVMYDINEFIKEQTQENKDDEKNAQNQGNVDNQIKKDNSNKVFTIEDLQPFLKKSNWDRLFNGVVEIDGGHLKKKWSELYVYRCKIAHNNQFIRADYNKVREIIDEIKPQIDKAIENLDNVDVSEADSEMFSENYATVYNQRIKEFFNEFNTLSRLMNILYYKSNYPTAIYTGSTSYKIKNLNLNTQIESLYEHGVVDELEAKKLKRISAFRQRLVYQNESIDDQA